MKESIASALIIISLCSLCFFTSNKTSTFCSSIKNHIDICLSSVNKNDWEASEIALDKAQNEYNKTSTLLKTFCVHNDIDDIGNSLSALHSAIISKDKEESLLQTGALINSIEILSNKDSLKIENIL